MTKQVTDILLTAELRIKESQSAGSYDSTDVIVKIEEEVEQDLKKTQKYIATFFTYDSLLIMKNRHLRTGEYLNGKYFFFKNMVIIDDCSKKSICEVVNNLIEEGEFEDVFNTL